MRTITEATDVPEIKSMWQRVFKTNNPFAWPFQREIAAGRLFYPTEGYHLQRKQYVAVMETLRELGEDSFRLSIVESEGTSFLETTMGHWLCKLPPFEEYIELSLGLENALFSQCGEWGILISHEMHALIGGSKVFIDALTQRYPHWNVDLRLLREAWSGNPAAGWLETTMTRVVAP
jgi:hypothetical protein